MKFEKVRVYNFECAFRGMRNPKNSWDKSDSLYYAQEVRDDDSVKHSDFLLGEQDHKLMLKLAKAGTDHRKYGTDKTV